VIEFQEVPEFRYFKRECETAYVEYWLDRTNGNVSAAARWAGKERSDFWNLVKRCDVAPEDFRK
jgi:two-component system response regulator GlrR